jgi:hypothetical protein
MIWFKKQNCTEIKLYDLKRSFVLEYVILLLLSNYRKHFSY